MFENFSPGAGAGGKESCGGSGWNRYASMDPHRVRYTYRDDPEDLGLAIGRSTSLLHSGADAEPGLRAWAAVLQDKQHAILLDMNEGRPPEKFASAEANFFKIITELLQTSKVCEIKAGVEGAEEGRNRQLADFAMVFNQAQEHMRNHAEVMGCGEAMYRQNMRMLVGAAFGTAMDAKHMKKMKVTAELHESIRKIYEPKPALGTPGRGGGGRGQGFTGSGGSGGGSMQPFGGKSDGGGGGKRGGGRGGVVGGLVKGRGAGGGRKCGLHVPNTAEIVRGATWAVEKKVTCNRCGDGFYHEYFECPVLFAEESGGVDMPGWSVVNGKPVKVSAMWSGDSINDACRKAWRDAQSRGYFTDNPMTRGPTASVAPVF